MTAKATLLTGRESSRDEAANLFCGITLDVVSHDVVHTSEWRVRVRHRSSSPGSRAAASMDGPMCWERVSHSPLTFRKLSLHRSLHRVVLV